MESTEDWCRYKPPVLWCIQLSWHGSVAAQGLMAALFVVVARILIEDLPQAFLIQYDQMVEAFTPD
jgi:hypothetical protein